MEAREMSKEIHITRIKRRVNQSGTNPKQNIKCVRNRNEIDLNPRDVFYISQSLNMPLNIFLDKYCAIYTNKKTKVTMAKLNPVEELCCPFIADHKCIIYKNKPSVCLHQQRFAIYPYEMIQDMIEITTSSETQNKECFLHRWLAILKRLELSLKMVKDSQLQYDLSNVAFLLLYTNYLHSFEYQFEENVKILNDLLSDIQNHLKQ